MDMKVYIPVPWIRSGIWFFIRSSQKRPVKWDDVITVDGSEILRPTTFWMYEKTMFVKKSGYLPISIYQLVIARFLKHQKVMSARLGDRLVQLKALLMDWLASMPSPLNPSFCLEVCWLWNVTYRPSTMSCRWVFCWDIFWDNFWHIGTVWSRKNGNEFDVHVE